MTKNFPKRHRAHACNYSIALPTGKAVQRWRKDMKLSSLSMLILSFSAILIDDVPDWEWIAFVKPKDCVFVSIYVLCQSKTV